MLPKVTEPLLEEVGEERKNCEAQYGFAARESGRQREQEQDEIDISCARI
jgi:hypothetical protein